MVDQYKRTYCNISVSCSLKTEDMDSSSMPEKSAYKMLKVFTIGTMDKFYSIIDGYTGVRRSLRLQALAKWRAVQKYMLIYYGVLSIEQSLVHSFFKWLC